MNIYSETSTELLPEGGTMGREGRQAWERKRTFISRSHVPSPAARRVFNVVLCSGHFRSEGGGRLERPGSPGHEFFYCLSGRGYVLSERKQFLVNPFELAWLSGPRAHWADQVPWEVLWMRVDGHQVRKACEVLAVPHRPVFAGLPKEETRRIFHRVSDVLAGRYPSGDAALNCEVAELLGYLVESRAGAQIPASRRPEADSPTVSAALEQMLRDLKRSWRAGELARLCCLSERHFFRGFKKETGLSPIDWLRRERIRLAQRKLLDPSKRIKEICEEVGYHDVFFFSRDFKRHTGTSPSQYRREHSSQAKSQARAALV
jgi:AraC-like DNA-binding protein/quercetin dioxygenase-like cupin family protein